MHNAEQLLSELSRQVKELRVLYRSALGLTGETSVQALLKTVADDIITNTCLERLAIFFYHAGEDQFERRLACGFNGYELPKRIPARNINATLKKKIWRGESVNIVAQSRNSDEDAGRESRFQLLRDEFGQRDKFNRQPIHLVIQERDQTLVGEIWPSRSGLQDLMEFSHFPELLPDIKGPFILIPFYGQNEFLGLMIGDRGELGGPVPYHDARLTAAIVRHASKPIVIALKQQEMLAKIEEQNRSLKEAKERLSSTLEHTRHLKSFYESIIQNLRSGLITVDQKMEITHINKSAEQILGYSKRELLGKSIRTVLPDPDKAKRCIFRDQVEALDLDSGHISEIELVKKDGEHIPVETCFSIITDSFEDIKGLSCIFRDITEERLMEQQMARIERLASLGELAAGVAHEIKNPLAGINGALQVLAQAFPQESDEREIFGEILKQIKRLDRVVHQLLEFARPQKPDFKSINLIEIINRCLFLVGNRIAEGRFKTKISLDSDHPPLKGDPDLLQQAILNIILNALDAMEPGGTLEIHTCWMGKANTCAKFKCLSPINRTFYDGIRILIKDSGRGIPQDKLDTIFNPFFTTKRDGTGLGLAITHRIIDMHQGAIYVDSALGKGTIFIINLPSKQVDINENR